MKIEAPTLLEAVQESLSHAARFNPGEMVRPAAILWTDADSQWQPLVNQLKNIHPGLLTYGEYDPDQKIGPAIWLRCVIERTLPDVKLPDNEIPVIYMPGVNRQLLRVVEECPPALLPLVELQYRGTVWTQKNGKDWTLEAFLISEDGGLGLDVARDGRTRQAALGALSNLAVTPVTRLRGKQLEAEDFDKLMVDDTARDLLQWLNDSKGTREEWDPAKWAAFCSRCREEYDFDPGGDGVLVAGEKLGIHEYAWDTVWQRFRESPGLYSGVPDVLRRAKPTSQMLFDREPWPDENEKAETALRKALVELDGVPPADARKRVAALEDEHGPRRGWVWAHLGWSVLAQALEHLAALASATAEPLNGNSPDELAEAYVNSGHRADSAVLRALAQCNAVQDVEAVSIAVRAIYNDWLSDSAARLQALVSAAPLPCCDETTSAVTAEHGQCLFFVDGLRYDLGMRLAERAGRNGLDVAKNWQWAALPTVTATAKPALSPAAIYLEGKDPEPDFTPSVREGGGVLNADQFRKLLRETDYQVLGSADTGDPTSGSRLAWCEYGEFDKLGHSLQVKMAARVDEQLDLVMDRIVELLNAGWTSVRVVTDHGWLLIPGGLPVEKLPHYLAKTRWSRCAVVKESAHTDCITSPWYWNKEKPVAYCRDSHAYFAGNEYAHGGISLQECVTPDMVFAGDSQTQAMHVAILDVQWLGLRCRVKVAGASSSGNAGAGSSCHFAGLKADIRTKANDPATSVSEVRAIDPEGKAGLLVTDEDLEGTSVSVVLLDTHDRLLVKKPTTVGGEQ